MAVVRSGVLFNKNVPKNNRRFDFSGNLAPIKPGGYRGSPSVGTALSPLSNLGFDPTFIIIIKTHVSMLSHPLKGDPRCASSPIRPAQAGSMTSRWSQPSPTARPLPRVLLLVTSLLVAPLHLNTNHRANNVNVSSVNNVNADTNRNHLLPRQAPARCSSKPDSGSGGGGGHLIRGLRYGQTVRRGGRSVGLAAAQPHFTTSGADYAVRLLGTSQYLEVPCDPETRNPRPITHNP